MAQIDARTDAFLASPHAVALVEGRCWTTPEMLALEQHAIQVCLDGTGIGAGLADAAAVEVAIAGRPSLVGEQQVMVRRVTGSGNRLDVVVGPPGCGKTFALDAVREAYQASGHRVVGVALAARRPGTPHGRRDRRPHRPVLPAGPRHRPGQPRCPDCAGHR